MSVKKKLSRNQQRALNALLEYPSLTQAAGACGLNERTIRRYMDEPLFRAELASLEADRINEAARILYKGQKAALKALYELITEGASESTRRMAAATWMDLTLRLRELAIERRLADLEVAVYGKHR